MVRLHRVATILALVLVLAAGLPLASPGQEPGTPPQPQTDTVQAAPQPVAVPAAEVVVRAEADGERLRAFRSRAVVDPSIEAVSGRIPEAIATRDGLVADTAGQDLGGLTRRALQALGERWRRHRELLGRWQGVLAARSQVLGADQESLAGIRAAWDATAAAADAEGYPDAAVQTIAGVQATLAEVGTAIRDRVDAVLRLQNRVAELGREADDTLARIDAAEDEARLGLLRPEQPPLWTTLSSWSARPSWTRVVDSAARDRDTLTQFVRESAEDFAGQLVVLLVLLVLMVLLGRRARESAIEDPGVARAAALFTRPFSATILVFLLTMRLFHPRIPVALVDLDRLLALVPLLRLLPMLVKPAMRRPVYVFAALWLLHSLSDFLPDGSVVQRLGVLVATVTSLSAFIWVLRRTDDVVPIEGWRNLAQRLVRVGTGVLAVSALANVLGLVDLAALLTSGTLLSVLLVWAFYAGATVIQLMIWMLLRTKPAQSVASIRFNTRLLTRRSRRVVGVLAVVGWVAGTLNGFDLGQRAYAVLVSVLTTPLSVGRISVSLGNIAVFCLAIWIATLAARFTKFILEQDVFPRVTLPRGVPGAVTKVSGYVILGLGLMVAVGAAGFDLSNVTLLAGALGVGIGFGLQNIVNNFVSGLILIFERPIQVGDSVQLDTLAGTVKDIGIRASVVRTFEGAEVLVPNADLIAGRVVNWTLSDRLRRLEIKVGVAYGSDPHQVKQVLLDVTKAVPDCLEDPQPYVLFDGFGDSSLDFRLRFWTSNFDQWLTIKSDATYDVHDALQKAGITIPFPQRDLHVKSLDPSIAERTAAIRPERREGPPLRDTERGTEP